MTQATPMVGNSSLPVKTAADLFVEQLSRRLMATGAYSPGNALMVQALSADTLEEAMQVGDVISGRDYPDMRIRFLSVLFTDSDPTLDARIPYYALLNVVLDDGTGETRRMAIGAEQPLGVFIRAVEQGWFPFEGKFEIVDLGQGKKAVNLVPVPVKVPSTHT